MPIYRTRPLSNPYVGIDVGYYDRKALEKQRRFDIAREAWSKNVAANAANAYYDEAGRQQFLNEQNKLFQDVITKHSGNLSAGMPDLMDALDSNRTNPYHNLNKTQMENIKMQRELQAKYGADYIDQSQGLYEPLYNNGKWRDPSSIKAQGLQANDYDKIIEDQMNNLSPILRDYVGKLQQEGTPGYLQAVRTQLKSLSPEMLQKLANDPRVHQAFLANAPTALQDTRQYNTTGQTYADVLGSKEGFANFFMGNLIDKVKDERSTTRQFVGDKVWANQQKAINDKELEKYKYKLANEETYKPTSKVDIGKTSNKDAFDVALTNKDDREKITNINKQNLNSSRNELESILNIGQDNNSPWLSDSYSSPNNKNYANLNRLDFFDKIYTDFMTNGRPDINKIESQITNGIITTEAGNKLIDLFNTPGYSEKLNEEVSDYKFNKGILDAQNKNISKINAETYDNLIKSGDITQEDLDLVKETLGITRDINKDDLFEITKLRNADLSKYDEKDLMALTAKLTPLFGPIGAMASDIYIMQNKIKTTNSIKISEISDKLLKEREAVADKNFKEYSMIGLTSTDKNSPINYYNQIQETNGLSVYQTLQQYKDPSDYLNKGIIQNIYDRNKEKLKIAGYSTIDGFANYLKTTSTKPTIYMAAAQGSNTNAYQHINLKVTANDNTDDKTNNDVNITFPNVEYIDQGDNIENLFKVLEKIDKGVTVYDSDKFKDKATYDNLLGRATYGKEFIPKLMAMDNNMRSDFAIRTDNGSYVNVNIEKTSDDVYVMTTINPNGTLNIDKIPKEGLNYINTIMGKVGDIVFETNKTQYSGYYGSPGAQGLRKRYSTITQ